MTFVIETTAALSALSFLDGGIEHDRHQRELISAMTSHMPYRVQLLRLLNDQPQNIILTRDGLMALLRLSVVLNSTVTRGNVNFLDHFLRATLGINEQLSAELDPPTRVGLPEDIVRSELCSTLSQQENPHLRLARMDRFFSWSRTEEAHEREFLDVERDLQRFTGLSFIEFVAAAYSVTSRSLMLQTWRDVERERMIFDVDQWLGRSAKLAPIRRWISDRSSPINSLRREWQSQSSLSLAASGSLWTRPLIGFENGKVVLPSLDLMNNMFDAGIFWTLFDNYKRQGGDAHLRVTRFYGRFFERYVYDRLSSAYFNPRFAAPAFFSGELRYNVADLSTDVVVTEGADIIFIEVCAKRLNFVNSIIKFDPATIDKDVQDGIIDKIKQLDTNVRAFRKGTLFPQVVRYDNQRVFPVLALPTAWPRISLIAGAIPRALEQNNWLEGTEPIELLDVGEVELLEHVIGTGHSLSELLHKKNNSERASRLMSVNTYIYANRRRWLSETPTPTLRHGQEVAQRMVSVVESWFTNDATDE